MIVVEHYILPALVRVTGLALVAEEGLVFVVLLMASNTGHGRILKRWVFMAILACRVAMPTGECELGFAVIEAYLFPVTLHVAVGAGAAQTSLVLVVLLVAGDAVRRRLAEFCFRPMAIATSGLGREMAAG